MAIDYESIGARIRFHRVKNSLSQEKLAELANLSSVYISYIEHGERVPSVEAIVNIANALNLSSDELLSSCLFTTSSGGADSPFLKIMGDCTAEEISILLRFMKEIREILRAYRITK